MPPQRTAKKRRADRKRKERLNSEAHALASASHLWHRKCRQDRRWIRHHVVVLGRGEFPIEAEKQLIARSKLSEHPEPPSLRDGLRYLGPKAIQLRGRLGAERAAAMLAQGREDYAEDWWGGEEKKEKKEKEKEQGKEKEKEGDEEEEKGVCENMEESGKEEGEGGVMIGVPAAAALV